MTQAIPGAFELHGDPRTATWLIEAPHGADEQPLYDGLRALLRSPLPDRLEDFFQVNTDVGSWALSLALADALRRRGHQVCLLRCLIPRTFIDVNRVLDEAPGDGLTPGLQPWITDAADRELLVTLHRAYTLACAAAYGLVCGRGGRALIPHTYAPRSVPIDTIDASIVQRLHAVYQSDQIERSPLRPEVDFITRTPSGEELALPGVDQALDALAAIGVHGQRAHSYTLHPVTMGARWSAEHPGQVLCFEVRRDLVTAWDPFRPKPVRHDRVEAIAEALVAGLIG